MPHVIESVKYWSGRKDQSTAAAVALKFFNGGTHTATGEFTDLNTDGSLPGNEAGDLTAVMVGQSSLFSTAVGTYTPILRSTDNNTFHEFLWLTRILLRVQGVEVVRGSCLNFGGNAPYVGGSPVSGNTAYLANTGMLRFLSHELAPGNLISVEISSRKDLAVAFSAYGSFIDVTFQTQTKRLIQ